MIDAAFTLNDVMAAQLRHDFPTDYPPQAQWTIEIQPLQETLVGKVRPMLLVLLGAVILIVFIVSLNIANLLLARASGRQQEMAVRLALGASRGRMIPYRPTAARRSAKPPKIDTNVTATSCGEVDRFTCSWSLIVS